MQKNYLPKMVKSMIHPLASTSKNWKKSTTTWLVALFVLCGVSDAFAAVGITPANGTANSCKLPTDFVTLGNIVITEAVASDFGIPYSYTDYTLVLNAPLNFQFNPGIGSVAFSAAGDITAASITVTATTITITYGSIDWNRTNNIDRLTISGIQFRGITTPSSGNITRPAIGGGNGTITGITAAVTNFGTLTSSNTAPTAISGGAATVCTGASTAAFTNAISGGTWSITPGTGTASITTGGVVTGLTAGTVTVVYTIGTCTPATQALTIQQTPGAIGGGAATVCVGGTTPAFTNAVGGGTWSITNGTGSATISTSGVVTGVTAGGATVVYAIGSCSVTRAITITTVPVAAGSPTPINGATGVCYAGSEAVTSISWGVVAGATSYDVYFGPGATPPVTLTANVATNSYPVGALTASTQYSWKIVARNACGATTGTPATWTFTTAAAPCVCVPTSANDTYPISNVTFAGIINNSSASVTDGPDYQDFSAISGNVTAGSTYNISVTSTGAGGTNTFYQYVYFDWNNNSNFADDGGPYNLGNYTTATATFNLNITIPLTATIGTIKFRVVNSFNSILNPCATTGYFQMEDYSLNIIAPPACTTPTAVPTSLVLSAGTPSGTAINGSFTAAAPAPNSYLVVVSTSNIAPTIANGTTYTIGGNAGVGYTVVDTDTNTTFTAGGLNPSTTYYFYVYSMNNVCSGGPLYNATPLIGNLTTGATVPTYCNATTNTPGTRYIDDISFLGMLNGNIYNLDTGSTTTPAPGGYQDWTGLATKPRQAQGGGVNISFEGNSRGTWKAWVDWNKDGDFTDAGELVYNSAGVAMITNTFGFIIPNGATPGDYRVRIRTYNAYGNYNGPGNACDVSAYEYYGDGANHFDSCTEFSSYSQGLNLGGGCGTVPVTYTEYGEAEDYLFTVVEMCEANIVTVTDGEICGPGAVNVSVTGTPGTTHYRWYSAETGGALLATTTTGSWTTTPIAATTSYWVTAFNGSCESLVRTEVIAKISPLPTITFTPSVPEVCGENNIVSITAGGDTELVYLIDENFEGSGLGVFSNDHITSTAYNTQTAWQKKTSTYIPNGSSWYPAISSNFGANHFAIVTSDIGTNGTTIHNALVSPSVSTSTFLDLTLTFRMYFSRYYPDTGATHNPTLEYMQVEVSDNGGAWTSITGGNIVTDQGYGTDFKEFSYDMSAYINRPNIRVRIRYYAQNWYDGAAVDDIQLFGTRPLNTAFNYDTATVDAFTNPGATIPYVSGAPATTIYIKPTLTQLENATFNIPVSASLSNGCSATGSVTVTNNTKMFVAGTTGTDWNTATNWRPNGVPTANNCVVIFDNDVNITGTNYTGYGLNLTVKPTGNLNIASSNSSIITDIVNVEAGGVLEIENDASLVQINNVTNTVATGGTFNYKRNASVKRYDYVYWSSPTVGFNMSGIPSSARYGWAPTAPNANGGQGNWFNASGNMATGAGYIFRVPNTYATTASPDNLTATFTGVPFNGTHNITVYRGNDFTGTGTLGTPRTISDDNWNLIGNPYPSALGVNEFLELNTALEGFVYVWTHGDAPDAGFDNPFYQNYTYNYDPNDYITINQTGATSGALDYKIGAGQGFFVLMDAGAIPDTPGSATVTFNNSMRNQNFANNMFYRTANNVVSDTEKNRLWLDLNSTQSSTRILVGYLDGATNAKDRMFDAFTEIKGEQNFYSLLSNELFRIQGKALPFDVNDTVPLGVNITATGMHNIALANADGVFAANQDIYLEDTELGIIHDLRLNPYSFTAPIGENNTRFILRYTNSTLGIPDFENTNAVTVFANDNINVNTTNQIIKSVRVHDLLGRVIGSFNNVNAASFVTKNIIKTQSPLLVEVTLENGATKTFKVIY